MLFPLCPTTIASKLADLKLVGNTKDDLAASALVAAAETLVDRWSDYQQQVEERWRAYEAALNREAATRTQVANVLRSLVDVTGVAPFRERQSGRASPVEQPRSESPVGHAPSPRPSIVEVPRTLVGLARQDDADLAVFALGEFVLFCRGRPVADWHGTRAARLIRLLSTRPSQSLGRDVLIELLSPGVDPEAGRRHLHQTVYSLRKTLEQAGGSGTDIVYRNHAYSLNSELRVWLDVTEFETLIEAGRRAEEEGRLGEAMEALERAATLYRSDFLSDTPYEEWALPEADRLRFLHLSSTNHLADLRLDSGEVDAALELTLRVLEIEPCDEVAHRRAFRCHAAAGRRNLLSRQYESCTEALKSRLGLGPAPDTAELYLSLIDS
jgi:DNA-binding SARP family transcriptional activator